MSAFQATSPGLRYRLLREWLRQASECPTVQAEPQAGGREVPRYDVE